MQDRVRSASPTIHSYNHTTISPLVLLPRDSPEHSRVCARARTTLQGEGGDLNGSFRTVIEGREEGVTDGGSCRTDRSLVPQAMSAVRAGIPKNFVRDRAQAFDRLCLASAETSEESTVKSVQAASGKRNCLEHCWRPPLALGTIACSLRCENCFHIPHLLGL